VRHRRFALLLTIPLVALLVWGGAIARDATSQRPPDAASSQRLPNEASGRRPPDEGTSRTPSEATRCSRPARAGSGHVTVAAVVRSHARAYRRPGVRPFARFGRLNQNGFPTVFRVLSVLRRPDCSASWYRVQLPIKPNGVTGYVRASAVDTGRVRTRVVVDLSAKQLMLFRSGRPMLRTTVATGSSATPTPIGNYYVNQRLIPSDPSGPFGPGAIGISAYSTVLTGWAQGGPIAIHGTNEPWSIGHAASNGCIRVRNGVLRRLFAATPAGTPVVIRR
jgi:lipoprotein-anchoring transpeptidase ErfK/SrfK